MKLTNNPAWNQKLLSLRSYIVCALATLDHDDLEEDDPWENLEADLTSALAFVRQVLGRKTEGKP